VRFITSLSAITVALLLAAGVAHADNYADTITLFKNAGDSAAFFPKSYGFAVFPTVGEAGFIVGGARSMSSSLVRLSLPQALAPWR
jgi:hypothetical protein